MANYVSNVTIPANGDSTATYNIRESFPHIGTCSTPADTAAKEVTIGNFKLYTGAWVVVKFNNTNSAAVASLTLNVDSTGARPIKHKNANLKSVDDLVANRYNMFIYDGTNYQLVGELDNMVKQTSTTTESFRPILFGANNSTDTSTLANPTTNQVYASTLLYAQPLNGILYANRMYLKSAGDAGQLNLKSSAYNVMIRNDNSNTYFLVTEQNDPDGTWTSARPLTINNSTGVCSINGNAATSTKVYGTLTNPASDVNYAIPFHTDASSGNKSMLNNNGLRYTCKEGTASAAGYGCLVMGNTTNEGTAGNKYGLVRMYPKTGAYYGQIKVADTMTANRTYTLPNKDGTVALTSDTQFLKYGLSYDETSDFASYAWHKFAEVTLSSASADAVVTFMVSKTWGNVPAYAGILTAHLRTGSTKVCDADNTQFQWNLADENINPSNFVMVIIDTANTSSKVELWYKQEARYEGWMFSIIKENSRTSRSTNWTMFSTSGHGSATYTTGTSDPIVSSIGKIKNLMAGYTTTTIGSASAGTAISADDITAWNAGSAASLTTTTYTVPNVTGSTNVSIPNVTGNTSVSIPNVTGNTEVTIPNVTGNSSVTAKSVKTINTVMLTATISSGILSFTTGASVVTEDKTATNTTLGTALKASKVTLGTALSASKVTLGTALSASKVTLGTDFSIKGVNVWTAGSAPSLSYTSRSIPNISVTSVSNVLKKS